MGAKDQGGRNGESKPETAPDRAPPPRPGEASPLETVARLNATLDALPDLLFVLDREGRIVDYHAPSPERLYVPPDQFLGRTMDDVLPEPARGVVARAIADAMARGHHRGSRYPLPAPDGERWYEISIAAQGDPQAATGRLVAIVRDVTDRQRAEDALRESERTYRMLTEGMQDVIWILDVEARRFTYVSPSVEKLRGYTPAEILARPLEDAWVPEQRAELEEFTRRSVAAFLAGQMTSDDYATYEMLQPCKDGSTVASEVVARLVRNERTGRLEAHGVTRNISKRVQAEAALRASEARFAQLAWQSRTIVFEMDAEGRCAFVSPEVEAVLGYRPEELVGKWRFYELFAPADREIFRAAAFEIFRRKAPLIDFENPCLTKDGRPIWVTTTAFPLLDPAGRLRGYRGSVRDVTDRKRTEIALRNSEARFAETARQSRTFVWEIDADGLYMFVTPVVEDVLGYRPDEIAGRLHFYDLHPAEGREEYKAAVLAAARQGREFRDLENPMVAKDGRIVWVSTNALPLRGADGSLRGYRGSDIDITARKLAEESLRESEAQRRAINDNVPDGFIYQLDSGADGQNRRYTYVSRGVEKLHGVSAEAVLRDPACIYSQILAEDLARVAEKEAQAIVAMAPFSAEVRVRLPAGEIRWRLFTSAPRRLPNGHLVWDGIEIDVTDRKLAEEALRESEGRFAASTQASRSYVWQVDPEGLITYVSPMVEEVLGRRPEEIAGRLHFYDLLPKENREEIKSFGLALMARRETISGFENRNAAKDGRLVWLSSSATPLFGPTGTFEGYQGIDTDISARKQAEEALSESEARFAAATQASRSFVWQVDPDGLYTYVGDMVAEVLGYRPEDLVGRLHFYDLLPPEGREELKQACFEIMARHEAPSGFENLNVAKDGRLVWLSSSAHPLFDADGSFRGYQGIDTDITARKQAEEALKTSETRYRGLIDFAVDGILLGAPDGIITEANACMCALAGRTRRELVGKHIAELFAPETLDANPLRFDLVRQGEPLTRVRKIIRPDKSEVFVEMHSKQMSDGTYQSIFHDITQRKQAEEALRESETRFRELYERMRDSVAVVDVAGHILGCNPAFATLLGYREEELRGKHFREITPPGWEAVDAEGARQVMRMGFGGPLEKAYVHKNGTIIPVEIVGSLMRNARGQPTGVLVVVRDIAARKEAETALKLSEAKYRQLYEAMRDPFARSDLHGRLVEINPAFEELLGYSSAELVGKSFRAITPRKWHAGEKKIVSEQVRKRGFSAVYEKEYVRKDGSIVPVELRTMLIRDAAGNPTGMSAVVRDVTERKQAESALRQARDELERRVVERTAELESSRADLAQSEEQFRQMAENVQDVFWLIDARTQDVLYASPAFERMWKRPVGKNVARWFTHIHPDDRERIVAAFQTGMKNGIPAMVTYRLIWPDGSIRWIESYGSMVWDAHGRPSRAAGVHRDITEQRRLEAEILQASESERQRIGRDLHDSLGQSLTAIGYLADAVREDLARAKRPEAAEVRKLGRLIGQTAAEAHALARGMLLGDLKRGGLGAALQELASRTQELFGVACRYSGPVAPPPLDVHVAGQLYRIAQEAATNAAKHGQAKRIDVRLAKERRGLLLSVRDNGRGLPARKKNRARPGPGHHALPRRPDRGHVMDRQPTPPRHDGFLLVAPRRDDPEETTMKNIPDPNARKRKVLIVDDHPLLRDGLAKVLNQQSDLVVCGEAADARAGLAAAAKLRPDVVIADLTMDEGNGLDLIKDLHARFPKLPVLVLSMHHENLYAERAVRAGARGYVMKREPIGHVIAALRKVLDGHMALSEVIVSRLLVAPDRKRTTAADSPAEMLSDRELEVFRLFGNGMGTRAIAAKLRLAISTVESYRSSIKRKLGLASATELVARAAQFVADEIRG